ncbi:unnamed protein product [Chilo suppressalis]|uniref:Uncharacterized protein n=1 Tax=Chilo suppressalis TaxID=168631 RepID=A0ABN8BBT9_CHISP|nr:unnamed protein product [Chilo suppressalis]
MKLIRCIFFGVLLVQWVGSAPSEIVLEVAEPKEVDNAEEKDIAVLKEVSEQKEVENVEESEPQTLLDEGSDKPDMQGQRQKRWYNYYGFPPINPVIYRGNDFPNAGVYGSEDPYVQIHRRLQEISGYIRQPQPQLPPPPLPQGLPQFPPFFPILYIPQIGCACTPNNVPSQPDNTPAPPQENNRTTDNPGVNNRWPEMEDERQNWGFLLNDTDTNDNNDANINDGARPISFVPIRPNRTMSRPPPPVEHGSAQADINSLTVTTTVPPPQITTSRLSPPSPCDGAVLSCCHMSQVTYDCFAAQGCPDPSAYGNPCDPSVIVRVIERFREYYNQRSG